jgi:hypothetical protein
MVFLFDTKQGETQAERLLAVLKAGRVSTNMHRCELRSFCLCLGGDYLPWPILPNRQWPPVQLKTKRAIPWAKHEKLVLRA